MQLKDINNTIVWRIGDGCSSPKLILEIPEIKENSIIFYQTEMISRNLSKMICDMNLSILEHHLTIMYDIDSKVSLTEFLKVGKLEKHELVILIRNIIRIILMSERYFLNMDNFLLSDETVFIKPVSLDVSLIYLPIELTEGRCADIPDYCTRVSEDILELIRLLLSVTNEGTDFIESLELKGLSLPEMLQKLNKISLMPPSDKIVCPGTDNQIKIRQDTRQNISLDVNHKKIMAGIKQIFKAGMSFESNKKTKLLIFSLVGIQITALSLLVILQKQIQTINPENAALTYGLFGIILAGINTLIVRRVVQQLKHQ